MDCTYKRIRETEIWIKKVARITLYEAELLNYLSIFALIIRNLYENSFNLRAFLKEIFICYYLLSN